MTTHIIRPQMRAEWFINDDWFIHGDGIVRKNFCNWNEKGDLPLPGAKVCVIGMYDEKYDPIAEIAESNWAAYCLRHGYCLRTYPGAFHTDSSRPDTYGDKVRFKLYYDVRGIFDIVLMLDIDSMFVDMERTIEPCVDAFYWPDTLEKPVPEKPFLWTYGPGGPMSGLMIARSDDTTEKHLRYAYEYAATNNNVRHGAIEPNGLSDQDAMKALMHIPPFSRTFGNCVEAESIGFCFPDTKHTKPWIVTAKGGSFDDKLTMMREVSQKVLA